MRQYVNFVHTGVVGVRADTGQFLWGNEASANGTANCSSPLEWDGNVFERLGLRHRGAARPADRVAERHHRGGSPTRRRT